MCALAADLSPDSLEFNNISESETNAGIVYPEEVPDELLSNTENIYFSDEEIYGTGEKTFEDYYIIYFQILTGNQNEIDKLNTYYAENISETGDTPEEILEAEFSDDEISVIAAYSEAPEIYKLLICILRDDRVSDDEKDAIRLLLADNSPTDVLNAFMLFRSKVSEGQYENTDPFTAIDENIFRGTVLNAEDVSDNAEQDIYSNNVSEDAANVEMNSMAVTSSSDKEEVLSQAITAPKYYKNEGANIYIDDKSGNLRYVRSDVSVPLSNRTLTLDLVYDVSKAKAATYCLDEIGDGSWAAQAVNYSPLGVGWRFDLTYKESNIIYLKDGRNVEWNGSYLVDNPYNDIDVESISDNEILITYLDGSEEYLNNHGLLYKSVDKYGNITEYTYTNENLTKVSADGKEVIISYYDDKTEVLLPNGDIIRYLKENKTFTYGPGSPEWTATCPVMSLVEKYSNGESLQCAYLFFTSYEMEIYRGKVSPYFSGHEYCVFMVPCEIDNTTGYCERYIYEPTASKHDDTSTRTWALKVINKYKDYDIEYSSGDYVLPSDSQTSNLTKYVETFSNGKIVESIFEKTVTTIRTYRKEDDVNILLKEEVTEFPDGYPWGKEHIPTSKTTKICTSNGNFTTYKEEYSYNAKDQLTSVKKYIDGSLYEETTYEYVNWYPILIETKINDVLVYVHCIERNGYGDVIYEYNEDPETGETLSLKASSYDNNHRLVLQGFTNGTNEYSYVEYRYDNLCLPSEKFVMDVDDTIFTEKYTYDIGNGNTLSIEDGNGNKTYYEYDARGNVSKEIHADGTEVNVSYEKMFDYSPCCANPMVVEYENGYTLSYTYDYNGNISKLSEKMPDETEFGDKQIDTYDVYGNLVESTDALGNKVEYEYDIFGRVVKATYPSLDGTVSNPVNIYYYDVFFDGSQKCTAVITVDQDNKASISYSDLRGRNYKNAVIKNFSDLVSDINWESITSLPSNAQLVITETNTYDDLDRLIKTMDGENRPTEYTYDIDGNITSQVIGSGTEEYSAEFTYDYAGNITETNQAGQITSSEYDTMGRVIKTTDPMGFTEEYTYDLSGNLIEQKDKNNVYTYNTYDNMNRLTKVVKGDSQITYTYDDMGNMLTCTNETGTITYEYNEDGTLASQKYPDGRKISYTSYDANKNLLSMTDYFGNVTNYTYNTRALLSSVTEKYSGSAAQKTTSYSYNDNGSMNTVNGPNSIKTEYEYDYAGRVSYMENSTSNSAVYTNHTYTYDNSGNVTKRIDNIGGHGSTTADYSYDSANRLSREWTPGVQQLNYDYDEHSNIYSAIYDGDTYYTYDANNRLTETEDLWCQGETADGKKQADWYTNYTYDNNGNLLTASKYAEYPEDYQGNEETYTYDDFGRLIGYSDSLGETATYTYYADGLRASKTINGVTTKYYYNGANVINESRNNSLYAVNVMGADGYISRTQSGTTSYYMKNAHGDIVNAVTENGARTFTAIYTAWGEIDSQYNTDSSNPNPIGYAGEFQDSESGMIYLRGRYYDPKIRRFITEDPAKDGWNWYAYCENNPVMRVDPTGFFDYNTQLSYDPNNFNPDVERLQNELAWNGYLSIQDIDGYFGNKTLSAVNQYKNDRGLWNFGEYEGVVGLTTWQSLGLSCDDNVVIFKEKTFSRDFDSYTITFSVKYTTNSDGMLTGYYDDVQAWVDYSAPNIDYQIYSIDYPVTNTDYLEIHVEISRTFYLFTVPNTSYNLGEVSDVLYVQVREST